MSLVMSVFKLTVIPLKLQQLEKRYYLLCSSDGWKKKKNTDFCGFGNGTVNNLNYIRVHVLRDQFRQQGADCRGDF